MKLYHASLLYMQQLEGEDEEEVEEKDRRRMEKKKYQSEEWRGIGASKERIKEKRRTRRMVWE